MLKSYKQKQFLVFEFPDKKTVKYNLATGECIGKSGRVVKSVNSQLSGYDLNEVINSFEDENYRNFLTFVESRVNITDWNRHRVGAHITNVGTFLKKISLYKHYEQIFSSGVKRVGIIHSVNRVPKTLIKLCAKYDLKLTNKIIEAYKRQPDIMNSLIKFKFEVVTNKDIDRLCGEYSPQIWSLFQLVEKYNYKLNSLLTYVEKLMIYEGLTNVCKIIQELYDYVRMCTDISNKYEKYPKNFLTTHQITVRNYNVFKKDFNEKIFEKRINRNLEFKHDNYIIMYPNTPQDIKNEGINQNHCVGSYIDRVIDGKCHILFLRNIDSVDESLVTLQVQNNTVVQARGRFNRDVTHEEQEVIKQYNKYLGGLKVC